MSFNPNEISIGRVLSNNVHYMVPRYQRKYVWNEQQWKNLIEDILSSMNVVSSEEIPFHWKFYIEKKNNGWIIVKSHDSCKKFPRQIQNSKAV